MESNKDNNFIQNWNKLSSNGKVAVVLGLFMVIFVIGLVSAGQNGSDTSNNSEEEPAATTETEKPEKTSQPEYKEVAVWEVTAAREEHHFVYQRDNGVTKEKMISLISKLASECPDEKICDIMLWENKNAYNSRVDADQSDIYAKNNSENLIGYLNSGGLIYYYGNELGFLDEESRKIIDL